MTPEIIYERFAEAAKTLALLPTERPAQYGNAWPDYIRDREVSYNTAGAIARLEAATRVSADPQAIDRLDEVLVWSQFVLTDGKRKVMWGIAMGAPVKWIARKIGKNRTTVYRWRDSAVAMIIAHNKFT